MIKIFKFCSISLVLLIIISTMSFYCLNNWMSWQFVHVGWYNGMAASIKTYADGGWNIFVFPFIWPLVGVGSIIALFCGIWFGFTWGSLAACEDLKVYEARLDNDYEQYRRAHNIRLQDLDVKEVKLDKFQADLLGAQHDLKTDRVDFDNEIAAFEDEKKLEKAELQDCIKSLGLSRKKADHWQAKAKELKLQLEELKDAEVTNKG